MRYNLGFTANSNMLNNHDLKHGQTTANDVLNYSPTLNYSKTLAVGKILSLSYQGNNQSPTINQLQPVRNTQSLQNILVGNPDLKTSFTHNLNANFNYVQKSGRSLQVGLIASAIQNEIVSDVIFLPDTLNSLKQITRYENINGNYQVGSNYSLHIPFNQNKYSFIYSGRLGFSNRAILFNHQKNSAEGFNFSQQLMGNLSFKKITLSGQFSYTLTNNNSGSQYGYQSIGVSQIVAPIFFRTSSFGALLQSNLRLETLRLNANVAYNTSHNDGPAEQVVRNNTNINMNLGGQLTIRKSYFVDFGATKTANYGYAMPTPGPLLINAGLGKRFLKYQALNMSIRGNDLLGQGNRLSRTVSGNVIIDSRNQQPTRVFSLNLSYSLSNFGGKNMRVNSVEAF